MAQFDVFDNPNIGQRGGFPFVVVMQSDQLSQHSTRLVMPLARMPRAPVEAPRRLSQVVRIGAESLYPAAHLCGALPARLLRHPTHSLRAQADVLRDALDAVVSGI